MRGQRVWNTQPEGGAAALGISPSSRIRSRPPPSIVGTAESSASVYGWCGPSNTTSAGPSSMQPAEVEDGDAIGEVAHDAEVVGDEEVRDTLLRLQLDEEVEDRRLHGDVERRGRLVAHDELAGRRRTPARSPRAASGRPRAARAAASSVRSASRTRLGQLEHPRLGRRAAQPGELLQRAQQDAAHRVAAVERRVGVLEDDLERPQLVARALLRSGSASAAPSSERRPVVGGTMPSSVRASVVLPLPDSPTRPSVSPGQIAALTLGERVDVVSSLAEDLRQLVERARPAVAPRSTGGLEIGGLLARQLGRALVVAAAARRGRAPTAMSGGSSVPAALVRERAAVGEDAARAARAPRLRQEARDRVEPAVVLAHAAARDAAQEADRVRVARILRAPSRHGPSSTSRPAYSTPTRSHIFEMTPRLWLMKSTDVCSSAWRRGDEVEHLGLDRGVEPGRRLVEDQQRGILRERHRDHDPLLHAAGELVWVAAHHRCRVGDLDVLERVRALARSRSFCDAPSTVNTSATWVPTLIDGFSAAPGFW